MTTGKTEVQIALTLVENNLYFTCSNFSIAMPGAVNETDNGIGLKNVQRRLELCYPGRHRLKIDTTNNRYFVELQIQLL